MSAIDIVKAKLHILEVIKKITDCKDSEITVLSETYDLLYLRICKKDCISIDLYIKDIDITDKNYVCGDINIPQITLSTHFVESGDFSKSLSIQLKSHIVSMAKLYEHSYNFYIFANSIS